MMKKHLFLAAVLIISVSSALVSEQADAAGARIRVLIPHPCHGLYGRAEDQCGGIVETLRSGFTDIAIQAEQMDSKKKRGEDHYPVLSGLYKRTLSLKNLYFRHKTFFWMLVFFIAVLLSIIVSLVVTIIYRKRILEKLSASEEKFRQLFEMESDSIFLIEKETGRILEVNAAASELYGYTHDEFLTMKNTDVSAEPEKTREATHRVLKEIPVRYHRKKDGTVFPVEITARHFNRLGKEVHVAAIRDITEKLRAEETLMENEKKYRQLVATTGIGFVVIDEKGCIIEANVPYMKLAGAQRFEDIAGVSVIELTAPEHKEENAMAIEICSRQGYIKDFETTYLHGDGTRVDIQLNASMQITDSGKLLTALCRDITDSKKAEKKLRESETRFRVLFQQSIDGIFLFDTDGFFIDANRKMLEMTGYTKEEFLKLGISDIHPPYAVSKGLKAFDKIRRDGSCNYEIDWISRSGNVFNVDMSASVIEVGGRRYIQCIARDITDRKRLEAQLRRAQKMETLGLLAGGVAHDLNNVLSGIVSYPELLLLDIPEDSPLRRPIMVIQDSGKKAAAIVQDLLTLARRGITRFEVLNLNDIVTGYLESPEHGKIISYHPDVDIRAELAPDLLNIKGVPVQLKKSLMNLISNAVESLPGGGRVVVSTRNRYVDTPIKGYDDINEGDYALLTIEDNGTGIAGEDLDRIFEPFYTKKVMGRSGTGLGTAVVWGTVKDHNGYIHLESTQGKGTIFYIYFPATREEIAEQRKIVPVEDYMGSGETVLVVDDIAEQREIAAGILKVLNYSVVTVSSGEKAVAYIRENPVDLIVLDMIMAPGMDGLETYRRILELRPNQKAVIASGFAETEAVREAQKLGAGEYIKKPYTMEKIGMAVKKELDDRDGATVHT